MRERRKTRVERTLTGISRHMRLQDGVRRADLSCGEAVLVRTKNSEYRISPAADGSYLVSGGWFGRRDTPLRKVNVNGCTWGGSAICADLVAAPGLFLEFGNGVRTTRIQEVVHLRMGIGDRN